jgi:hypothetical protein
MTEIGHERFSRQTAFAAAEGRRWAEQKAAELGLLPAGTVVMFNVANGAYVTGATRLEAMDKFHQAFGRNATLGYSLEVGRPAFVGGGIA